MEGISNELSLPGLTKGTMKFTLNNITVPEVRATLEAPMKLYLDGNFSSMQVILSIQSGSIFGSLLDISFNTMMHLVTVEEIHEANITTCSATIGQLDVTDPIGRYLLLLFDTSQIKEMLSDMLCAMIQKNQDELNKYFKNLQKPLMFEVDKHEKLAINITPQITNLTSRHIHISFNVILLQNGQLIWQPGFWRAPSFPNDKVMVQIDIYTALIEEIIKMKINSTFASSSFTSFNSNGLPTVRIPSSLPRFYWPSLDRIMGKNGNVFILTITDVNVMVKLERQQVLLALNSFMMMTVRNKKESKQVFDIRLDLTSPVSMELNSSQLRFSIATVWGTAEFMNSTIGNLQNENTRLLGESLKDSYSIFKNALRLSDHLDFDINLFKKSQISLINPQMNLKDMRRHLYIVADIHPAKERSNILVLGRKEEGKRSSIIKLKFPEKEEYKPKSNKGRCGSRLVNVASYLMVLLTVALQ